MKEIQHLIVKSVPLNDDESLKVAKLVSFQEAIVALEDVVEKPVRYDFSKLQQICVVSLSLYLYIYMMFYFF